MGQSSLWINMHRHAGQVARPDISLGPTGQEQGQQKTSQINMGNGCEGSRATSDPTAEGVVSECELDKANRIITREKAEFEHLMYTRFFLNWGHKVAF